jgi:hypothetical protein
MTTYDELLEQIYKERQSLEACRQAYLEADKLVVEAKAKAEAAKQEKFNAAYRDICNHLFEENKRYCAEQRQQGNLVYLITNAVIKKTRAGKEYISFTVVDGEDKHRTLSIFYTFSRYEGILDSELNDDYYAAKAEVNKGLSAIVNVRENDRGYLSIRSNSIPFCRTISAFETRTKEAK